MQIKGLFSLSSPAASCLHDRVANVSLTKIDFLCVVMANPFMCHFHVISETLTLRVFSGCTSSAVISSSLIRHPVAELGKWRFSFPISVFCLRPFLRLCSWNKCEAEQSQSDYTWGGEWGCRPNWTKQICGWMHYALFQMVGFLLHLLPSLSIGAFVHPYIEVKHVQTHADGTKSVFDCKSS